MRTRIRPPAKATGNAERPYSGLGVREGQSGLWNLAYRHDREHKAVRRKDIQLCSFTDEKATHGQPAPCVQLSIVLKKRVSTENLLDV